MKVIILCAGEGTRLRPLTNEIPKCLVEYKGISIIERAISVFRDLGVQDITLVGGYRADCLERLGCDLVINSEFHSTNMLYSLFCARPSFGDDIVVCYGDIIFSHSVAEAILNATHNFSVIVDLLWRELWQARMENPLADAETLKLDKQGFIRELGQKPESYDDIEGQYIGLFRVRGKALKNMMAFYDSLDPNVNYFGRTFSKLYMTDFLQLLINSGVLIKAESVAGGWLEVDSPSDLEIEFI